MLRLPQQTGPEIHDGIRRGNRLLSGWLLRPILLLIMQLVLNEYDGVTKQFINPRKMGAYLLIRLVCLICLIRSQFL
jgi:hypothetical protein